MLTLDNVDFIENWIPNWWNRHVLRFLEYKRLFPLLCSARFWGQPGELSLFVLFFPFAQMNNLQLVLNILEAEHMFVPFTALYITSGLMQTNFILDSFWLLLWKCVKRWEENIWLFGWTSRDLILPMTVIPSDHQVLSAKCLLIISAETIFIFDGFADGRINKIS